VQTQAPTRPLADLVIAFAVVIGVLAVSVIAFLNPVWVAFEQGRAEATAWTGFDETDLRTVTDAILSDLVLGPPAFDVALDGEPVLNDRERSHMRDVRTIFMGFFGVAAVLGVAAVTIAARRRDAVGRARTWGAVRAGALALVVALVVVGAGALVAFDVLFEIFHSIFFAGGTYTFDPSTERLVQLFPFRFWQETAMAVGVVAVVLGAIVALVATRRRGSALEVAG
jgi:integral membrane protein (TIGR01906 family)